jgi:hypothetical protein
VWFAKNKTRYLRIAWDGEQNLSEKRELKSPNSVKTKSEAHRLKIYETTKERRVLESQDKIRSIQAESI